MTTLTFQQGVNNYTGTVDTMLREAAATTSYGTATALSVDSDDPSGTGRDNQVLLQFEDLFGTAANQIPVGATITSATLTLRTTNKGDGASLYRMLTPWSGSSTWDSVGSGIQADGTEAASTADRVTGSVALGTSTFDVTTSVQAWADWAARRGGTANHGWAFLPSGPDGWDFYSSEGSTK